MKHQLNGKEEIPIVSILRERRKCGKNINWPASGATRTSMMDYIVDIGRLEEILNFDFLILDFSEIKIFMNF
jgi:hypothetical protein